MDLLLGFLVAIVGGAVGWYYSAGPRRRRLRAQPFPEEWVEILKKNVELYRMLPQSLVGELHGHIQVFLGEKSFEGCGGLVITDEIRVTVAGLACMLLLNRPTRHYPGLKAILVYPAAYIVDAKRREGAIQLENAREIHLGESWNNGTLVLSWCDVTRTSHDVRDGHNLVLHEFAHQLDQEDGVGDGIPILEQQSKYFHWAQVLDQEYQHLVAVTERGKRDVLQAYGATNPAEFFAVATEAFFEKPAKLHRKHPELYKELKDYYQLDPETWKAAP